MNIADLLSAFPNTRLGPRRWLVTGAAGFIGSNLVESLLDAGEIVVGFDNFSTGHKRNIDEALSNVGSNKASRFEFVQGDIRDAGAVERVVKGISHVLHQAALGSVPRSLVDPITTNDVNIGGFLNMLDSARRAGVVRFVYAASSSTYGDDSNLPKIESRIGRPLSPYAVTKYVNELYARVYKQSYDFPSVGLRYFNVFGARQDPDGAYAAVIPKWIKAIILNENIFINGDGETSRDFCYVANAVQANILAALKPEMKECCVLNVACGDRTSLNDLATLIRQSLGVIGNNYDGLFVNEPFRLGDVRHSLADISLAKSTIGYIPTYDVKSGLAAAMPWYIKFFQKNETKYA